MKAYSTNVPGGMQYTPHELVFGRSARVPSSTLPDDKGNESYSEYMTALFNQIFNDQHARTSNMQKLDLSDNMIIK